jgi:hypothetical protein
MRKTILTMIGSALLAGSLAQGAAAGENRHVRKVYRTPAPVSQSIRDSNAAWADTYQPGWSGYYSGGYSAPAGR